MHISSKNENSTWMFQTCMTFSLAEQKGDIFRNVLLLPDFFKILFVFHRLNKFKQVEFQQHEG